MRDQQKYKQESQECGGTHRHHRSSPGSSFNMRRRSRFRPGAEHSVLGDQRAFHIVAPRRRYRPIGGIIHSPGRCHRFSLRRRVTSIACETRAAHSVRSTIAGRRGRDPMLEPKRGLGQPKPRNIAGRPGDFRHVCGAYPCGNALQRSAASPWHSAGQFR